MISWFTLASAVESVSLSHAGLPFLEADAEKNRGNLINPH
jgi:hypothetical protein